MCAAPVRPPTPSTPPNTQEADTFPEFNQRANELPATYAHLTITPPGNEGRTLEDRTTPTSSSTSNPVTPVFQRQFSGTQSGDDRPRVGTPWPVLPEDRRWPSSELSFLRSTDVDARPSLTDYSSEDEI